MQSESVRSIEELRKDYIMVEFRHFGTVFVKEDSETGKVVQKPGLFMRQSHSVQLYRRSVCDFVARSSRALVRQDRAIKSQV